MDKLKSVTNTDKNGMDPVDSVTWRDFTTPVARKAIFIGVTLLALKQFSGLYAMLNYSGHIFKESGSFIDPNLCSIIIGVIQLIGTYVPTLLVDRAGRKVLLTFSTTGTGVGLVCLGTYLYLKRIGYNLDGFGTVPLASFSFSLFLGCCGLMPLPFVIVSEIMPQEVSRTGACPHQTETYFHFLFRRFDLVDRRYACSFCGYLRF